MLDPAEKPYHDYGEYLKKRLGAKTYKVSVDGGFTCPNIDGTVAKGGCTYCNNRSFVPKYLSRKQSIQEQVQKGVERQRKRYKASQFLAYFQAYSNTYADVAELEQKYRAALAVDGIVGLVVGTRADCLPEPVLDLLQEIAEEYYVALEIGVESIYDQTLERINRGHRFYRVVDALERSQGRGFDIGTHFIFGLPGETRQDWLHTAEVINELGMTYTKLHHLHVVKGTQLARQYREEPFFTFTFKAWTELVADLLERIDPQIVIARMAGSAPPQLLIAPHWEQKGHGAVKQQVARIMAERNTVQGQRLVLTPG